MNPHTSPPGGVRTSKSAVALIAMAVVLATAARVVISPLQELVKADLGLSDNQVALLQGLALALPVVVLSYPIGRLVDRANRCRVLFLCAMGCAIASIVTAFAHQFVVVVAARMVVGLTFMTIFLSALSLLADLSEPASRGRLVMLLFLGQVFGRSASFAVVGAIIDRLPAALASTLGVTSLAPWRLVELVFGIVIALAGLALLRLREPERHEMGEAANGGARAVAREFWRYRGILVPLLVGIATINMADTASEIWAVPVVTRKYHQTPAEFGNWMGLIALVAGVGGALAGGLLSDLGQRRGGQGGILLGAIVGAVLSIPGAFYPMMPSVHAFAGLLAFFLISGSCNGAAAVAAATVLIPNEIRGVVSGVFAAISGLVASGVAPLLVSGAAQAFGLGGDIALPLAVVGCATSVVGSVAFILSLRAARRARPPGDEPSAAPHPRPSTAIAS
jgi:MFS family permease